MFYFFDPNDPVQYYTDSFRNWVEWPPLDIPAELDIPPALRQEPVWSPEEWLQRGLASNYRSTDDFQPLLHADVILDLWQRAEALVPLKPIPHQAVQFLHNLAKYGYSSQLYKITQTKYKNVAIEARLWSPAVHVLHTWLNLGFICGPYPTLPYPSGKCNGLLLIPKGASNVRVCSDFSRPLGDSFNSAVNRNFKRRLPLRIANFANVKRALQLAGSSCWMMKNDIKDAYKMIQVRPDQVKAQQFSFGGCYFYDTSLVFGDCSAVHAFSFAHYGIVHGLVLPYVDLHPDLSQLCIDDLINVAPFQHDSKLWDFFTRYQYVMNAIGFKLQDWSDDKMKSFGPSQQGLLLGVWVCTKTFTWNLPPRKLSIMLEFLEKCIEAPAMTINQLQKLCGRINYLIEIDVSFSACSGFVRHQLAAFLKLHPHWSEVPSHQQDHSIVLSQASKQDLMVVRSLLNILKTKQFPLEIIRWHAQTRIVFTDASGCLGHGVGGVLLSTPSKAFSIPLPDALLECGLGHVLFIPMKWRTCTLELLPIWASLLIFAGDVKHTNVLFYVDNLEATIAINKKTSNDYSTVLLLRLIFYTASILDCHIEAQHIMRRSTPYAVIADDLTHFSVDSLFQADPFAIYTHVPDLPPVLEWMNNFAAENPTELYTSVMAYLNSYQTVQYLVPTYQFPQHHTE